MTRRANAKVSCSDSNNSQDVGFEDFTRGLHCLGRLTTFEGVFFACNANSRPLMRKPQQNTLACESIRQNQQITPACGPCTASDNLLATHADDGLTRWSQNLRCCPGPRFHSKMFATPPDTVRHLTCTATKRHVQATACPVPDTR